MSLPGRLPGDPQRQVLSPHHQLADADGQGAAGLDLGEKESVTACPSDLPTQARSWVNVLQGLHAGRGQFPGAGDARLPSRASCDVGPGLLRSRALDPDNEEEVFGRLVATRDEPRTALDSAEDATGAVRGMWVTVGLALAEYHDYVSAGRTSLAGGTVEVLRTNQVTELDAELF